MNPYRCRILDSFRTVLQPFAPLRHGLDFGGGDGWFAWSLQQAGLAQQVTAVDVQPRPHTFTQVTIYDGQRLPFADRAFDLVSSVDVLHHCPDPRASLTDLLRCADRFFLLKDHTYRGAAGKLALCLLDEIGNRRFGIPSPYHYQKDWEWSAWIEEAGFELRQVVYPVRCHVGPLGWATNALQFVSLWERKPA
jgi:SAM-dependent methyltransferase